MDFTRVYLLTVTSYAMGAVLGISPMIASWWLLVPYVIGGLIVAALLAQINNSDSSKD